jgi:hypothetical protein
MRTGEKMAVEIRYVVFIQSAFLAQIRRYG